MDCQTIAMRRQQTGTTAARTSEAGHSEAKNRNRHFKDQQILPRLGYDLVVPRLILLHFNTT